MDKLCSVEWLWDFGKVKSTLIFESGEIQFRENNNPPPTNASHDIAHFICGFNGNLEWDYENIPNHIAEYNAVFLENLMTVFCTYHYNQYPIDTKIIQDSMISVHEYMKWFSEDYYFISKNHPSKKSYIELQKDFLEFLNIENICEHFLNYYQLWIMEETVKNCDFNIQISMRSGVDWEFKELYDYLIEAKQILLNQIS
jgi:hypothetical protein